MTNPPTADLMIGKYHILELAGEGAMGAVYRARDTVLNRSVAIKVMNATIARDTDLRDRFLREAQAAGSLQHPNVVTIFDFGEVDGHLYIAMEFVEGTDLEQLLAQEETPALEIKLDIIIDALAGLAYAHEHGIVHRDLKPANIRVTSEMRGKLMDFGVAHLESSKMTKTGTMIGTPSYMAPEYISGKPVTSVSDVFSMGAVLYHVLTGNKPFEGDSLHAVLFSVVQSDPPLPSSIVPSLPSALDGIVRRAMAKDPVDRFQSALEMASALAGLRSQMRGQPVQATQSLSTTLAHRVASRGAAAVRDVTARTGASSSPIASASASAPASASVSAVASLPPTALPPDLPAAAPRAQSKSLLLVGGGVATVLLIGAAFVFMRPRSAADSPAPSTSDAPVANGAADVGASVAASVGASSAASSAPSRAEPTVGAPVAPSSTVQPSPPAGKPTPASGAAARPAETKAPATVAASASQVAAVAAPTTSAPPITAPVVPPPAAVAPPPAAASEPVVARNVPNELREVIARYSQAISARDIVAIRAVYSRITSDQQRGFERFFASTKSLEATLTLGSIQVSDATADGQVSGVYTFTTSSGSNQRQVVNFHATFERDGDKWRLSSVK